MKLESYFKPEVWKITKQKYRLNFLPIAVEKMRCGSRGLPGNLKESRELETPKENGIQEIEK